MNKTNHLSTFLYYTIIGLRFTVVAALFHFVFKTSPIHGAVILGLFLTQESLTFVNNKRERKFRENLYGQVAQILEETEYKQQTNWN